MDIKTCTDAELLGRILPDSDTPLSELELAWQEFYDRTNLFLLRVFQKLCRSHSYQYIFSEEDFYDMSQQIYSKLLENDYSVLRELKYLSTNSIRPYLVAAATNLIKDHLRTINASRRIPVTCSINEFIDLETSNAHYEDLLYSNESNPEEKFLSDEFLIQVLKAIEQESEKGLEQRNQDIFLMAYLHGFTRTEIAEYTELKLKRAGINSYLKDILPRIKKRLIDSYYVKATIVMLLCLGSLILDK